MDIIWIGFAFLMGFLVSRIKLPPLVGYLAAGLLLSVFDYEAGDMLHEIAHFGVLFLLFTVGLHIRVKNIFRMDVFGVGLLHLVISILLFFPVSLWFGYEAVSAFIIAVVLGFSSTVLAAKNLENRNELGALYGRIAIGILIIQDLVAIAIIALTGGGAPDMWSLSLFLIPIMRPLLVRLLHLIHEEELLLLMGLALAIGGASLFEAFNLSGELGALVIGMLIATDEKADLLGKKLWGIKEAFLIGFFLEVGLTGFPEATTLYFILFIIFMLPLKSVIFYLLFMLFRLRARTAYLSTISLSAYSEFTLIAGAVAQANGYIPEGTIVVFGLLTAVSFALNAPFFIKEESLWKKIEPWLIRFERDVKHRDKDSISLGSAEYLIIGMGNAGQSAYETLKAAEAKVVGMDIDPDRIERNLKKGRRVVYGDIQDTELWANSDISNLKSVMIAMGNRQAKLNAIKVLRNIGFKGSINVITMRADEATAMEQAGADPVSIPINEAGQRLARLSLSKTNDLES